ncbi:hypothetical protein KUV64_22110 [Mameliella alba]|uniref:hypothetical protein n=1 Tax=Mameliella alba TaxID=561184 RepID=UPI001C951430|nr:hypothetical protein [Mameliella alba]MBY6121833.1 hypothetical protein [Mameliella alba]
MTEIAAILPPPSYPASVLLVPAAPSRMPCDAEFRPWLRNCLARLGVSSRQIALAADLSSNSVSHYLRAPDRSISLCNAHTIMCKVHEIAEKQSVTLPGIGGRNV